MKWHMLACLLLSIIIITHSTYVQASQLTVPFQNISLAPQASMQASFAFGTNAEIFCFDSSQSIVGNVTWPYNGQLYSSSLPLLLTINSLFTGLFSDPTGILTITNTTTSTLQISCLFGFYRN